MTTDTDAPQPRSRAKTTANALTLKLGSDSKITLPVSVSNLAVMAAILWKMMTSFASLPDQVAAVADDRTAIRSDIDTLKTQGHVQAEEIGKLKMKVEMLEEDKDKDEGAEVEQD